MTAAKLIEYHITRQLLRRREGLEESGARQGGRYWAERLIAVLAVTAGLSVVGSYSEEMLWAGLAIATLVTLR